MIYQCESRIIPINVSIGLSAGQMLSDSVFRAGCPLQLKFKCVGRNQRGLKIRVESVFVSDGCHIAFVLRAHGNCKR